MNKAQILKLLATNRELILQNNFHAAESLTELNKDCAGTTDEEIILNLELNNSLAELHFHSRYDKVIQNSLTIINKFKHSPLHLLLSSHYWLVGNCYALKGSFELAQENLFKAMKLANRVTPVPVGLKADIYLALTMNEQLNDKGPEKSIEYLEESLAMMKDDSTITIRKANTLMRLGNVYLNAGRNEEALEHYFSAASTFEHHFDLPNMACAYSNIGTVYINQKNYGEAKKHLEKSLELRVKVGSPDHLSISYYNLAIVYRDTKNYDAAKDMLQRSKDILIRTGAKPYLELTENMLEEVTLLGNKESKANLN